MIGIQFVFYADWVKFGDSLQDMQERINYYSAISRYGAYNEPPNNLTGDTLAYFNEKVRPMIDKQRKKHKYGSK